MNHCQYFVLTLRHGFAVTIRTELDKMKFFPPAVLILLISSFPFVFKSAPQWGAADAEIKVPSGENTELKRSPFKACI